MHDTDHCPRARPGPRRRWKWLGVLSAAALFLHVVALGGAGWAWPARERPPLPGGTVQVRVVDVEPNFATVAAATPTEVPAEAPAVTPPRAKATAMRVAAKAPSPPATTASSTLLAQNSAASAPTPAAAATASADEPIPHYRTRMPPATTLRYEVRRGFLVGIGDLSWRPQGDQYELKLDASVSGLPVLTQASTGGFDTSGIAPLRFTDQRLRRGTTAANFQREAGKITFSGPATEFALRDGAQDRLSWMVQLAAIVAGEPQLAQPGAKVVMFVVGSHGDADVWVFRRIGPETVSTGAGDVEAIKFVREARETYDTTVQVWLDPRQHHLPVRALQKSGANGEGFDLRLREVIYAN